MHMNWQKGALGAGFKFYYAPGEGGGCQQIMTFVDDGLGG